jgi:hypothetical protein
MEQKGGFVTRHWFRGNMRVNIYRTAFGVDGINVWCGVSGHVNIDFVRVVPRAELTAIHLLSTLKLMS